MARTSSRKGRSRSTGISVDLSGVEVGGKTLPEGDYVVSVSGASLEQSKDKGSDYIKFEFEVSEGKHKGYKLYHNCSLQPQALFSLKAVLAALGFDIPKKAFDLDLKELIGLECSVEVAHEVYQGKKKSRIVEFIQEDSDDEDSDGEDLEEALEDLDSDELKKLAKEVGIKAGAIKKAKTQDDLIDLILEEDEDEVWEAYDELFDEDEDDSDEDDEEESEDEEDDEDYESMSLADLKTECKDRGIKVKKGMKKADLIDLLEEDDEE